MFYRHSLGLDDPGIKFIQEATMTDLREAQDGLSHLTGLARDASAKFSKFGEKKVHHGFSHLHGKLAAMEAELNLVEAVKNDIV